MKKIFSIFRSKQIIYKMSERFWGITLQNIIEYNGILKFVEKVFSGFA